jgi:membrane protein DedA with SNARE-associated domain
MAEIEAYLMALPQSSVLLFLGGLMFVTCLGFIPNNTDITVLTAGMLSGFGHFSLWQVLGICILGYFLGEGFMFSLGQFIGKRAERWRIYQKAMGGGRKEKVFERIETKPLFFFLGLRMTPVLRPFVIFSLGVIGVKPQTYYRYYLPITFFYTIFLGGLSFIFSQAMKVYFADYKYYAIGVFFVAWMLLIRKLVK